MKVVLSSVIVVLLVMSGCYMFQASTEYYGIKTIGKRVVFVLDISGSMEGKHEGSAA